MVNIQICFVAYALLKHIGPMKSIHPNIDLLLFFLSLSAIIAQKGGDAWWYMTVEELLPAKYRDKAAEYEKGTDTMDVWFDSGTNTIICLS